jgi:hypothetical protein
MPILIHPQLFHWQAIFQAFQYSNVSFNLAKDAIQKPEALDLSFAEFPRKSGPQDRLGGEVGGLDIHALRPK